MHFWIDKRSHSQCAYSAGRHRIPSSLSSGWCACGCGAGTGAGGGARGRGRRKGMAAPVHRFANVDCPPRRPHRQRQNNGNPQAPAVHYSRRQNEEPSLYVEVPIEPPQPTIASLAAARSVTPDTLLRTAALGLHHSPMMAPHLKFGMFASFALATVVLAGAKYYFDRQLVRDSGGASGAGGETGLVCAALAAAACGASCALSACRRPRAAPRPPERVSSTAQRVHQERAISIESPEENMMPLSTVSVLGGSSTSGSSGEAPPPYHIAVLLPPRSPAVVPRTTSVSPPPPAYSALTPDS